MAEPGSQNYLVLLINFLNDNIGMIFAGAIIGCILGGLHGYTSDDKRKRTITYSFVGIIIAVIGGGLYFYSNKLLINNFIAFVIFYAAGFGLMHIFSSVVYNKSHGNFFKVISLEYPPRLEDLRRKYGPGFIDDDELILEAIEKGKKTVNEIAVYSDLPKKQVKQRMNFLAQKGVIKWEKDNK
ncbi:MAG: hypothetical protein QXX85_08215 [Candidatus Nitrosotenuis sp.]